MKKIKFLLLGIVSILGIGLSFGYEPDFDSYLKAPSFIMGYEQLEIPSGITQFDYTDSCVFLSNPQNYPFDFYDYVLYSVDGINYYSGHLQSSLLCGKFYLNNLTSENVNVNYLVYSGFFNIHNGLYGSYGQVKVQLPLGQSKLDLSSPSTCVIYQGSSSDYYIYSDSSYNDYLGTLASEYTLLCGDIYINNYVSRVINNWFYVYTGRDYFPSSPGGNDNTGDFTFVSPVDGGIFDFNSFLIEKSILCYMSNGTFGGNYGNCDGIDYSGFVNQFDHNNPIWSGSSESGYIGIINFFDASALLSYYCLNTDSIQYQFCSQLDLYSGADLMYYYENGKLDYYVLGSGFAVDLGNLGSGQLGELTCTGVWCDGTINTGLPEYIIPEESEDSFGFSGSYLSAEFFNDFVSSGFFFRCPFPYSGSYFTLGKKVIDSLGGRDLLIPINCFIAGYSAGVETSFFGDPDYGRFRSGSLLSGSTPGHQRLFLLFDIIISFGLVFFFIKMFNFLFGHG